MSLCWGFASDTNLIPMANKNQTLIYLEDGQIINAAYNLGQYEKILNTIPNFKRVHFSYIINTSYLSKIEDKAGFLRLKSGEIIPINKNYNIDLMNEFIVK